MAEILISRRITGTKVVTRDKRTKGKSNKGKEGHADRCSGHLRELVFSPIRLPVVHTGGGRR